MSGTVYTDLNGNGTRDAGEPAVAGATVTLDTFGDGGVDGSVVTQADGKYQFLTTPDGSHTVTVTPPVNYFTAGANTRTAAINPGTPNAELRLRGAADVRGRRQGALRRRQPRPAGDRRPHRQLDLQSDGTIEATTVTDKTGAYLFTNVPNGTHTVGVAAPVGTVFNVPANANRLTTVVNSDIKGGLNFGVLLPGAGDRRAVPGPRPRRPATTPASAA